MSSLYERLSTQIKPTGTNGTNESTPKVSQVSTNHQKEEKCPICHMRARSSVRRFPSSLRYKIPSNISYARASDKRDGLNEASLEALTHQVMMPARCLGGYCSHVTFMADPDIPGFERLWCKYADKAVFDFYYDLGEGCPLKKWCKVEKDTDSK